jgi:M6 family metalloprotease-like protein
MRVFVMFAIVGIYLSFVGLLSGVAIAAGGDAAILGTINGHGTDHINNNLNGWLTTRSQNWTKIRRLSTAFVTEETSSNVTISISADAYVEHARQSKRIYLRLLVDGRASNPESVTFATSPEMGSHAFVFRRIVAAGTHIVEIEWKVDRGTTGNIRNGSVVVQHGSNRDRSRLRVTGKYTGGDTAIRGTQWRDVVSAGISIFVRDRDVLNVIFSAESYASRDSILYLRALVDGQPVLPNTFNFTGYHYRQSRTVVFGVNGLEPGWHNVQIQARSNGRNNRGFLGKRNLVLTANRYRTSRSYELVKQRSEWSTALPSSTWQAIPGLTGQRIIVPPNGEVIARFSADIRNESGKPVYLRMMINGQTAEPGVRTFRTNLKNFGAVHAEFIARGLNTTSSAVYRNVSIEWKAVGQARSSTIGPRTLVVSVERGDLPNLAGRSRFADNNPEQGQRELLVIIVDSGKDNAPAPTRQEVERLLWRGPHSVSSYYSITTASRITLHRAGVLGPYGLDHEYNYYRDIPCDSPGSRGYVKGGREIWMEILRKADQGFNFAVYDRNKDGILTDRELSILFIMPDPHGGATRDVVNCGNAPQGKYITLDGVEYHGQAGQWGVNPDDIGTALHELGHVLFGLKDMYVEEFSVPTEPGFVSLMGDTNGTKTSLLDPQNRLALGWATPVMLRQSGHYTLEDIGYSNRVFILPRLDGLGNEYFVLENRRNKLVGHSRFDENISDSGLGVWHIIDPISNKSTSDLDLAPACDFGAWQSPDYPNKSNARRGIRLVRPGATTAGGLHSFFDDQWPDLTDDPVDASCPQQPGMRNDLGREVLTWADGTRSRYTLRNFSAPGRIISFDLEIRR